MAAVNEKFVREELEGAKEQLKALRKSGKVSPEADALFGVLMPILTLLVTVLLEKTTRKTSRNLPFTHKITVNASSDRACCSR